MTLDPAKHGRHVLPDKTGPENEPKHERWRSLADLVLSEQPPTIRETWREPLATVLAAAGRGQAAVQVADPENGSANNAVDLAGLPEPAEPAKSALPRSARTPPAATLR